MKKPVKIAIVVGGLCAAGSVLGSVAFADTTTSSTPSSTVKTQLQSDVATFKQLQVQNTQLNQQLKAAYQAWSAQNPNPLKKLSTDQQNQVKTLQTEIRSEQSILKPLVDQAKSLRAEFQSAKQAHDAAKAASLKQQLQSLQAQIKPGEQQIQSYRQQIETILPQSAMKAFREQHAAWTSAVKSDVAAMKGLKQQLQKDEQILKADRQNKASTKLDADLQKVNADLTSMISAKQQLLKALPAASQSGDTSSNM